MLPNVLLDSCSSFHVTCNLALLENVETCKDGLVTTTVGSGQVINMTHKGTLRIVFINDDDETSFSNVYFSKELDLANSIILSVGYLDEKVMFAFHKGIVTAKFPHTPPFLKGSKNKANLYLVEYQKILSTENAETTQLHVQTRAQSKKVNINQVPKIVELTSDLDEDLKPSDNEG